MKITWILVAEAGRARILCAESSMIPLYEAESFIHPEGRLHEQKLTSDLPGRQVNKYDVSYHSISGEVTPKEQEAINFARILAHHLDEAWYKKKFNQLILIAAPKFLGLLRKFITKTVAKQISFEMDKNLCKLSVNDIRKHLPVILPNIVA